MNPVIVKLGGTAAADADVLARLVSDLTTDFPGDAIIVHGGGAEASTWCSRLGLEPRFVDGVRQTTPEEMEIVEMVLAGKVNTAVVRTAAGAGAKPVGLSLSDAGLCFGRPVGDPAVNRTARPDRVDPGILEHLLSGSYLPVVSSIGSFGDGGARGDDAGGDGGANAGAGGDGGARENTGACNINADDAALALAQALKARALVFLSNIPGVQEDDRVHRSLDRASSEALIQRGVISAGMTAKVRSALAAVEAGVGAVVIGEYHERGDIQALIGGHTGTLITKTGGEQ